MPVPAFDKLAHLGCELCEDEGCPNFGTPHVCNPRFEIGMYASRTPIGVWVMADKDASDLATRIELLTEHNKKASWEVEKLRGLIQFLHKQGTQDEDGDMRWSFCLSKHHRSMESALQDWMEQKEREK